MAGTYATAEYIALAKRCELLAERASSLAEKRSHMGRAAMFRRLAGSRSIQKSHQAAQQALLRGRK